MEWMFIKERDRFPELMCYKSQLFDNNNVENITLLVSRKIKHIIHRRCNLFDRSLLKTTWPTWNLLVCTDKKANVKITWGQVVEVQTTVCILITCHLVFYSRRCDTSQQVLNVTKQQCSYTSKHVINQIQNRRPTDDKMTR